MHAELNGETLRAIARDANLHDQALSILLWMLSYPADQTFPAAQLHKISRYRGVTAFMAGPMSALRQAGYVSMIGVGADGLAEYRAAPKPIFDDFGLHSDSDGE